MERKGEKEMLLEMYLQCRISRGKISLVSDPFSSQLEERREGKRAEQRRERKDGVN